MAKRGRPTKFTPLLGDQIVNAVMAGNYINVAAAANGIDSHTLHRWLKEGARAQEGELFDFCTTIKKAFASAETRHVGMIALAAQGTKAKVAEYDAKGNVVKPAQAAIPPTWQASAWWLERRSPKKWGQRVRVMVEEEIDGVLNRLEERLPRHVYLQVLAAISEEGVDETEESEKVSEGGNSSADGMDS